MPTPMTTYHAGFHRGHAGSARSQPRCYHEAVLTDQVRGPWEVALAYADTLPASEKAQGQIVLHRAGDNAIFVYACATSYVPEHTKVIPEQITRRLSA